MQSQAKYVQKTESVHWAEGGNIGLSCAGSLGRRRILPYQVSFQHAECHAPQQMGEILQSTFLWNSNGRFHGIRYLHENSII